MNQPFNLDEGLQEYFEFIAKGHLYKFRYPTTTEIKEMDKLEKDEEAAQEYIFTFITKTSEDSPEFNELTKQMTLPHWNRFLDMITTQMKGNNESNQSTKSS